jgi:hypothetical protein
VQCGTQPQPKVEVRDIPNDVLGPQGQTIVNNLVEYVKHWKVSQNVAAEEGMSHSDVENELAVEAKRLYADDIMYVPHAGTQYLQITPREDWSGWLKRNGGKANGDRYVWFALDGVQGEAIEASMRNKLERLNKGAKEEQRVRALDAKDTARSTQLADTRAQLADTASSVAGALSDATTHTADALYNVASNAFSTARYMLNKAIPPSKNRQQPSRPSHSPPRR